MTFHIFYYLICYMSLTHTLSILHAQKKGRETEEKPMNVRGYRENLSLEKRSNGVT